MTAAAPWSVKGIDPKAREMAKDLARRSGMTLGEWLNQMILEEDTEGGAGSVRPTASVHTLHSPAVPERDLDQLVETVAQLRLEQRLTAEKLRALEQGRTGRSAEAMKALGAALDRAAGQLSEGEARTQKALEALRRDMDGLVDTGGGKVRDRFAADLARIERTLEGRLRLADKAQAGALETLGSEIARIVERLADRVAKAERRSAEAADELGEQMGRLAARLEQRYDRVLADVAERLRQSEERSARLFRDAENRIERRLAPSMEPLTRTFAIAEAMSAEAVHAEEAEDFDMAEAFPQGESALGIAEDTDLSDEWAAARARTASIRAMLAAARAAAQEDAGPEFMESAPEEPMRAEIRRRRRDGSLVRTALLASGVVAALGGTATYVLSHADLISGWTKGATQTKANLARRTPSVVAPKPAVPPVAAPAPADGSALLDQAKALIAAGDPAGLSGLTKAANLNYAPAQFYLARLYEQGGAGLKKDPVEARRWTERAAANGDPKAMHNLALYYFHGEGGTKDPAVAANWFRRAADLGLVDSQYNLAQLYEQGQGVSRNPAEAYRWFLIAERAGDADARTAAERLKASLTTGERQAAERAAAEFKTKQP